MIHQFVIANHMLTGHIAALSNEQLSRKAHTPQLEDLARAISYELQCAEDNLRHSHSKTDLDQSVEPPLANQTLTQLAMIFSLVRDVRKISARLNTT